MEINNYVSLNKLSIFLDNLKMHFADSVHTHVQSEISDLVIDNEVSDSSNLVRNSAVNSEINKVRQELSENIEMAVNYTDTEVANLVNSAPETLDTLGELAIAMQENEDVVEILNDAIATKYSAANPPPYPVTSVQGKTGSVTFTTETWTFTLANGSTVTKKVLLG